MTLLVSNKSSFLDFIWILASAHDYSKQSGEREQIALIFRVVGFDAYYLALSQQEFESATRNRATLLIVIRASCRLLHAGPSSVGAA